MLLKQIHRQFLKCSTITIDSRKVENNCMFVAIKGERFDAHTFVNEALEKGAAFVIIDNPYYYVDQRTILVEDTLVLLQKLSQYHRKFLNLKIIALTGSNGKTTTKELILTVLSKKYKTKATVGNLNNHIGVPLTLLSFTTETEIGIVEMGANHQKEIDFLCSIVFPDFGYITNFGKAHLEGFGGIDGVIKGKSEIYDFIKHNSKKVFVNLDDEIQNEKTTNFDRITFGLNNSNADIIISAAIANPLVEVDFENNKIKSHLIGIYNAPNIFAAIAIGKYFEITNEKIKEAIESYTPENNRSQLLVKNSNEIILDAYNANPSSMKAAIDNFIQLSKPNKTMLLGDMFELGEESMKEHQNIVNYLSKLEKINCLLVGEDFYKVKVNHPNLHFFKEYEDSKNFLIQNKISKNTILIKGSRGMALERLLNFL